MRVIFVRHGEPDYALDCLTPAGRSQARAAAEKLKGQGVEAIYSSPLGRARETAQFASDALNVCPVRILDFMRELRWGSVNGQPIFADGHPWDIADELARTGWDLTAPLWAKHPLFENNRVTAEAQYVAREIDGWLETLGYRREGKCYRCIREDEAKHTVALFCHGGSSTAALAQIFSLPFPYLCAVLHLPFAGAAAVRFARTPGGLCMPILESVEG